MWSFGVFRRLAAASLIGAGAASMAATAPGCSSAQTGSVSSPCPPGETCQVHLTLFHTADMHSRLLPYDLLITQVDEGLGLGRTGETASVGGAARMSTILQRERARAGRSLHLSGGDCFQGAPIFNFFSGQPEMRMQTALHVDAMVIANHEFDRGPVNVARQIQKWSNFPVLAANYKFSDPALPSSTPIGSVVQPFTVFNLDGLKVGVIGMANLSSLTSIFDQPNSLGVLPLSTAETAQFFVDLLRPLVDVVVVDTHLGLEVDQRMIRETTGIDVVLGSHNHIVINPPQAIRDCSADPLNPGYVWVLDPNVSYDPRNPVYSDLDTLHAHPNSVPRKCTPRNVVLAHSGAFAKYVGRLDLVLSNNPAEASPTGNAADYVPLNGFEVVSNKYQAFPVTANIPEDPVVVDQLQPYIRVLDNVADLDILVAYSPTGAKRSAPQGGDSPLGNLVGTSIWLRLGVQSDFALTNSTGIRQDLLPGPVTIEEMYNIFPFDNSIAKMQLSGFEVQQMFDFVARRSAGRGCVSQSQIAGARVQLNCTGCARTTLLPQCNVDSDCPAQEPGACNVAKHTCNLTACAEHVYIGTASAGGAPIRCQSDADCKDSQGQPQPGACSKRGIGDTGVCLSPIQGTNLYELATSNYLAGGGSGFRVLQRNTTQFDTKIQQRDALIDYMRQGKPCGYDKNAGTPEGLQACGSDSACSAGYVCACPGQVTASVVAGSLACTTSGSCDPSVGRCVRSDCRDQVAQFHDKRCAGSTNRDTCRSDLNPCQIGGESCKILSCADETLGAATDNRVEMLGR